MNSPTEAMSPSTPQNFLPSSGLTGAAVARPDGIDEDEVGLREPRVLVVDERVRGRRHHAVVLHLHALRPEGAEVQPHGRGARAAVEREHERPLLGRRAAPVERVRDEEDVRLEISRVAFQRHEARRGGVLEDPSAGAKLVVRDDGRLLLVFLLFGRLRRLDAGLGSAAGVTRRGEPPGAGREERSAEGLRTPASWPPGRSL